MLCFALLCVDLSCVGHSGVVSTKPVLVAMGIDGHVSRLGGIFSQSLLDLSLGSYSFSSFSSSEESFLKNVDMFPWQRVYS